MSSDFEFAELRQLELTVSSFMHLFSTYTDPLVMIYPKWNMHQVLAHIVFWHESFQRNLHDVTNSIKPKPLRGSLSHLNEFGVSSLQAHSIQDLLERLRAAQLAISHDSGHNTTDPIPYRVGSRSYLLKEHLVIVHHHIKKHMSDILKAVNSHPNQPDRRA